MPQGAWSNILKQQAVFPQVQKLRFTGVWRSMGDSGKGKRSGVITLCLNQAGFPDKNVSSNTDNS